MPVFADVNAAFVLYPALLSLGAWIFAGLAEAVGWATWEKHQGCLLHRDVCVQAAVLRMGTVTGRVEMPPLQRVVGTAH